jgi:hypothetical protein
MRESITAPPQTFMHSFPAQAAHVCEACQFLRAVLEGWPTGDDAVLCISELACNTEKIHTPALDHALTGISAYR